MCEECKRLRAEVDRLRESRDNWRAAVAWVSLLVGFVVATGEAACRTVR